MNSFVAVGPRYWICLSSLGEASEGKHFNFKCVRFIGHFGFLEWIDTFVGGSLFCLAVSNLFSKLDSELDGTYICLSVINVNSSHRSSTLQFLILFLKFQYYWIFQRANCLLKNCHSFVTVYIFIHHHHQQHYFY